MRVAAHVAAIHGRRLTMLDVLCERIGGGTLSLS